ncbi:GPI transamidase component PIG-S-like [Hondaea fermentalgiana]|uniref:GPI transamidase component PIG-S-like n=1 Tax=Hondaea fermentalgiana TaxID=2315210 RepID=A0A2R5GUS7_9STRA|nr:GPI transamidase component PIG-S-like [Hondaea fermentalgiana]|eukprot:GBG34069.1 GPI transamidase component PIG-S-like [Hondaea fermentalgiana]
MAASAELLRRVVCAVLLVAGCLGLAALVLERALEKSAALPLREAADLEARVAKATADSGTEPGDEDASCTATYRLVLGLMVDESARGPVDWDVEAAVARHLSTFLADVSALARFEIDTQVLYFSTVRASASFTSWHIYLIRRQRTSKMSVETS